MGDKTEEAHDRLADAKRLIRKHAIGAAALGLVPLPLVDVALLIGVQVNLVRSLAKLYDVPFSEDAGKSVIIALVGASVPISAYGLLRLISPVALIGATAASAASTYAVGKVFVQHFESGGTFLSFDPEKVRAYYVREAQKGGIPDEDGEVDYGGVKP